MMMSEARADRVVRWVDRMSGPALLAVIVIGTWAAWAAVVGSIVVAYHLATWLGRVW